MSIEERLKEDLKTAMKTGQKHKVQTLRMTLAQLKDERIRLRHELNDDETITIISRAVKSRKDSIEQYKKGNRQDLVDAETFEMKLLQNYLPQQMEPEEIKKAVQLIIESVGAVDIKDIGKVMGQAMTRLKGKADGKLVQQFAREILSA